MILSYHPCFEADTNLLCAGREPDAEDLAAIKAADAVILPQGCYRSLYEMAHSNCKNVFPNYDSRFEYSGKIGQIRLFKKQNVAYPKTKTHLNIEAFSRYCEEISEKPVFDFPFVFKFDWGGEGDLVYLIKSAQEFQEVIHTAEKFEKSGQSGFIIQEYIPSNSRSLRVAIIGQTIFSYWRVQKRSDSFMSNLAKGALIDFESDPKLQDIAIESVKNFCLLTGINLAGFDILFSSEAKIKTPLFLEINHYFGRRGLGGSEKFYAILTKEIEKWIESLDLSPNQ